MALILLNVYRSSWRHPAAHLHSEADIESRAEAEHDDDRRDGEEAQVNGRQRERRQDDLHSGDATQELEQLEVDQEEIERADVQLLGQGKGQT